MNKKQLEKVHNESIKAMQVADGNWKKSEREKKRIRGQL